MDDELKAKIMEYLRRDLDELKQNKVRVIALGVCLLLLIFVWLSDDGGNVEEIDLSDATPVTKDLPVQKLPAKVPEKMPEALDGVKIVIGANVDELFINDPFAAPPKPKPEPPKKIELPPIPPPAQPIQQPPPKVEPKEKLTLTGTAISGDNKTAMFLRGKQTVFLTVGDEIDGRIISEITPDSVTFADGLRIYIQRS